MKLVEAVVHKLKVAEVRSALEEMGVVDFLECDVISHSPKSAREMTFRGAKFVANVVEKVKLEILSADEAAEKIAETLGSIIGTGHREDCRLAVRPYPDPI